MSSLKDLVQFIDDNYSSPKRLLTYKQLKTIMDIARKEKRQEINILREAVDLYLFGSHGYFAIRLWKCWARAWKRVKRILSVLFRWLIKLTKFGIVVFFILTYIGFYNYTKIYLKTYSKEQVEKDIDTYFDENSSITEDNHRNKSTNTSLMIEKMPGQAGE